MVPYVAKHPEGVAVDHLAEKLGVDRDEMLADLDLLTQVGPPDGDPGEYLLVSVEDGRVFVDLAHRLTRPLRLTPAEGCSLLLGIRALRQSGDRAVRHLAGGRPRRKLLAALGRDAARGRDPGHRHRGRRARHRGRPTTCAAWSPRRGATPTVEIDYVSASRARPRDAALDPYGIVHHAGEWYVVGHCHKRGDVRTFRIDRIAALAETDASASSRRPTSISRPTAASACTCRRPTRSPCGSTSMPLAVTRVGAAWPVGEVEVHRRRRAPRS